MVPNYDEDDGSLSIERDEHKSDVLGMWIKLKMPKQREDDDDEKENDGVEIGDQKLGIGNEEEMSKYGDNNMKRVCYICQKTFSSGKALGGHMRSHVQLAHRTKFKIDTLKKQTFDFVEEKVASAAEGEGDCRGGGEGDAVKKKCSSCAICGKNFPSMKSLFGHMRCHPNRDWRGINPPSSAVKLTAFSSNSSSSSLSSLSDANPPKIDDRMDSGERYGAVDLTESLRGWAVTAKRGRKAAAAAGSSSEEDDRLRDAVNFLLMLAEGKNIGVDEVDESDELKELMKKKNKMKKSKRKKVKLCDLNLLENDKRQHNSHQSTHSIDVLHRNDHPLLDFDLNEVPPPEPQLVLANYI